MSVPARGHMPFPGHRTVEQLDEIALTWAWCDQCQKRIRRSQANECPSPFCKVNADQSRKPKAAGG